MIKIYRLVPLAAALVLAGCINLAPDYERPEAPVAQAWPEGESYKLSEVKREALPEWRDFICDEKLRRVIELALANNRDLRMAAYNVEMARAQYGISRSELFPTVAAVAQETAQRTPETLSTRLDGTANTTHQYSAQLAMTSFELDFFGRVRNLEEQALQSYLQTQDAQRSAQSTLIAEVAMAWLTLGADEAQLKLQQETLRTQEESFRLVEASYKYGAVSQLDLEQARQTVAAARAAIASYVRAVAQDRNALELLVGAKIDEGLMPDGISLQATLPASLPEGLPSEVLLNRPDVMQAERGMLAANAQIGAARAAFFPSVSLTGGVGSGSMRLSDLFASNSTVWTFSPNVNIPIFTGGANIANLRAAEAYQKKSIADYELAIQTAFQEVADALATEGTVADELLAQQQLAAATAETLRLSEERYKNGADSYLEVLDSQRSNFSAQQAVINAQLSRAASLVTLYKVLGGGSQLEESAETTQTADAK